MFDDLPPALAAFLANRPAPAPKPAPTAPTKRSTAGARMTCQHCRREMSRRCRGLCWACFYTPGVKEQYPSISKFARRGVGNGHRAAPLPEPTTALPGTPEKVAVLCERARRREQLFHPDDATFARLNSAA